MLCTARKGCICMLLCWWCRLPHKLFLSPLSLLPLIAAPGWCPAPPSETEYIVPNAAQDPRLQAIMNNVTASEAYLAHYKTVTAPLLLQLANATGLPEQEVFVPAIKVSNEGGAGEG